jgi:uncharacterized membrane-anchored protein
MGYAAKGLQSAGWWDTDPVIAVGVSVSVVVVLFYLAMRRARRYVFKDTAD